jgi:hypothetical protein
MVLACDTDAVRQRLPFDTHTFHSAFCHRMTRRIRKLWSFYCHSLSSSFDSSAIVYDVRQRGKRLRRIIHRVEIFLLKGKKKSNKKGAQKTAGQNPWPSPWLGFFTSLCTTYVISISLVFPTWLSTSNEKRTSTSFAILYGGGGGGSSCV